MCKSDVHKLREKVPEDIGVQRSNQQKRVQELPCVRFVLLSRILPHPARSPLGRWPT